MTPLPRLIGSISGLLPGKATGIAFAVLIALQSFGQPALAGCVGRDLWAAMPAAARAKLEKKIANDVFARGRFFRVTKNGKTSYLFGTMHAPAVGPLAIPQPVLTRLRRSKTLFVEVTDHEEAAFFGNMTRFGSEFMAKVPTNFARHFSAAEWQFITSVARSTGLEGDLLARARPWYVYMQMSALGCASGGGSHQPIMDARIEQIGRAAGIRVQGLETPLTAIHAMQGFSPAQYAQMIRAEVWGYRNSSAGDLQVTRTNLYTRGNIQLIWQFQMMQFAAYGNKKGVRLVEKLWEERMLGKRNRAWMPTLLKAFGKGDAFVAVGALHLGGKFGLMRELSRRGYRVARIEFRP